MSEGFKPRKGHRGNQEDDGGAEGLIGLVKNFTFAGLDPAILFGRQPKGARVKPGQGEKGDVVISALGSTGAAAQKRL